MNEPDDIIDAGATHQDSGVARLEDDLFDLGHRSSPVHGHEVGREGHDRLDPALSEVEGSHQEGVIELLQEATLPGGAEERQELLGSASGRSPSSAC